MALPFFLNAENSILEHFNRSLNHIKSWNLKGRFLYSFSISIYWIWTCFQQKTYCQDDNTTFLVLKGNALIPLLCSAYTQYSWPPNVTGHPHTRHFYDTSQRNLACCSPQGCRELDTTEWLSTYITQEQLERGDAQSKVCGRSWCSLGLSIGGIPPFQHAQPVLEEAFKPPILEVFIEAYGCRHGWLNHWLLVTDSIEKWVLIAQLCQTLCDPMNCM